MITVFADPCVVPTRQKNIAIAACIFICACGFGFGDTGVVDITTLLADFADPCVVLTRRENIAIADYFSICACGVGNTGVVYEHIPRLAGRNLTMTFYAVHRFDVCGFVRCVIAIIIARAAMLNTVHNIGTGVSA